jgi:3-hydroxybutyryl-CoA dehydrogenase
LVEIAIHKAIKYPPQYFLRQTFFLSHKVASLKRNDQLLHQQHSNLGARQPVNHSVIKSYSNMKIGIIGAGAMGTGIAQVAAQAGNTVRIYDADEYAMRKANKSISDNLLRQVEKGKITEGVASGIAERITFTERLAGLGASELVIEAVVEDLEIKKLLFAELEMAVTEGCILATNTSSLSVTALAAGCQRPERFVGIHFFNPATLMQLVEVIPAVQTDPSVVAAAKDIVTSWSKTVVLAKDTPAFIVNRVARPFYGEALRIHDEGIADCATIDAAMRILGNFKMGPFELMDFIGHDVNFKVTESVFTALYFDPRYKPSFTQKRLLEAGYLGRKTGRGFYHYDSPTTLPNGDAWQAIYEKNTPLSKMVFERILALLINEAADALQFQVCTTKDLETAMALGVNYPKGLMAWADEWGIANVVKVLDDLYDLYREDRYRCSAYLRQCL